MKSTVENAGAVSPVPRLIPVVDWNKFHEWPRQGGLRHLVFHAKAKGFETAFIRCGRRVLVNEGEFFNCIARNGGHGAAAA